MFIASFELITGFLGFSISSTSESLSSFCYTFLRELKKRFFVRNCEKISFVQARYRKAVFHYKLVI
ncbi:hypothetical protein BpHYR1_022973 [Brachionus plicatilis]|uniref:Uncharacterized protein n=1 Tax=Brachionus plicatilis TaxID=10195 RepID=A0A3M7S0F3_BRAPC|nr:hypothetical protein BpHYR1_022973 [Brachionus plicatilis]